MFQQVVVRRTLLGLVLWGTACAMVGAQAPRPSSVQATPDFSGQWVLEKIDQPGSPGGDFPGSYGPPGGGRFGDRPPDEPVERATRSRAMPPMERGAIVTITQSETELVTKFGGHERVYALARPEGEATPQREPPAPEEQQRKSRTYWDGTKLVTEIEESRELSGETVTLKSHEVRTLSSDGKTMTVETTLETPRGTRTVTQVFKRRR
ncbi:MAG: hypothetical protein GEU99_05010 [Luteitalea sp.]|nr:hypothetical protein [Luteitalea sp.]